MGRLAPYILTSYIMNRKALFIDFADFILRFIISGTMDTAFQHAACCSALTLHVAAVVAATCGECLRALQPSFGALESEAPPRFRTRNGNAACNPARARGSRCQIIALLPTALLLLLHVLLLL